MNIRAKIYGGVDAPDEPILKAKKPKGVKADALHSIAVARESRHRSNSRGEDRHRLSDEQARVTHNGTEYDVALINLSGGGAMIAAPFQTMLWDRVDLHLGQHGTIECAVRWIREDRVGLEFAHETRLDGPADQVAIVLRHVIAQTFPHIAFVPTAEPEEIDETEESDESRAASRHPLIWNGVLHHDYQSTKVRVRNISSTGAMIESSVAVQAGIQPLLELNEEASVSATVEWCVGDQIGLSFHSPFDLNLLAKSRPAVATTHWSPPAYLAATAEEAGDGVNHWKRLTLVELHEQLEGFIKR